MAHYLADIDSGRAPVAQISDPSFHSHAHAEFDAICEAICRRLQTNTLPPDEAFWWTRILFSEAVVRLHTGCPSVARPLTLMIAEDLPNQAAA